MKLLSLNDGAVTGPKNLVKKNDINTMPRSLKL